MLIKSAIYPIEEEYINDFDVYRLYNVMRLHFTTQFDAVKYNFKSKAFDWKAYQKVSMAEVNMYQKWANTYTTKQNVLIAIASHFHYNQPRYFMEYAPTDEKVKTSYAKLKQFLYSPTHYITKDLTYINENATIQIIRTVNGNIPKIYPMAIKGLIREESLVCIDVSINLTKYISTKIDSFTWNAFKKPYLKYSDFVCTVLDPSLVQNIKTVISKLEK